MDDLFMLDDMDLAVPPLDNALMDDYIMELANMSTTPTHMQGSQQHPMWGMGSSGSQNAPLVPMAAPQASQRMQGMHQASAGLQSAAWPPELLGHLSQVQQAAPPPAAQLQMGMGLGPAPLPARALMPQQQQQEMQQPLPEAALVSKLAQDYELPPALQAQLLTHMAKKGGGRSSALQQQPQVPPMAPQQAQQGLASLLAHQQGLQGASAPAHQSAGGSMGSALGSTGFGQDFGGGFGFGGMHQQQQRQQVPMQAAGHPMLQQQLQMAGGLAPVQQQLLQRLQAAAQTNPQAAQLLQSVVGDAGSSNLQRHLGAAYPGQGMQQGLDPDTLRVVHALSQQGLASQTSSQQQMAAPLGFGGAQMGVLLQQQQQQQQQQQGLGAMLPQMHQQQQQGMGAMLPRMHQQQQHFMPPTSQGSGGSHMSHPAPQGPSLGLLQRGSTPAAAAHRLLQEFGMGQLSLPQQQGMPRSSFAAAEVQQVPVSGMGGSSSGASHPQQLGPPDLADLLVHAASDDPLSNAIELEERVGSYNVPDRDMLLSAVGLLAPPQQAVPPPQQASQQAQQRQHRGGGHPNHLQDATSGALHHAGSGTLAAQVPEAPAPAQAPAQAPAPAPALAKGRGAALAQIASATAAAQAQRAAAARPGKDPSPLGRGRGAAQQPPPAVAAARPPAPAAAPALAPLPAAQAAGSNHATLSQDAAAQAQTQATPQARARSAAAAAAAAVPAAAPAEDGNQDEDMETDCSDSESEEDGPQQPTKARRTGGGAVAGGGAGGQPRAAPRPAAGGSRLAKEDLGPSAGGKPKRRRVRDSRQQELNKLAQHRYRERKKAAARELEERVQALADEAAKLELVKTRHQELQARNLELQNLLGERDSQLARLGTHEPASSSRQRGGRPNASKGHSNDPDAEARSSVKQEAQTLAMHIHQQVFQLEQVLKDAGLDKREDLHTSAADLDEDTRRSIVQLVGEVCGKMLRAARAEGADVWAMVRRTVPNQECPLDCDCMMCRDKEEWTALVQMISLTEEQIQKLLFVRSAHMKKLEHILNSRTELNLEAIALMGQMQGGPGDITQLVRFATMGFYERARGSQSIARVLEQLRENLKEEARSTAEFDYIIFRRVFTPVQGARLIIEAYPLRCDCLAFTNAVVQLHGPHFTVPEHGASAGSSMARSGVSSEGGTASKENASHGNAVSTSVGGVSQATRPDAALQSARG